MDQGSASLTAPRVTPAGADSAVGRAAAFATGAGLAAFVVGTAAESVIIRAVHGLDDRTVFVFAVGPGV